MFCRATPTSLYPLQVRLGATCRDGRRAKPETPQPTRVSRSRRYTQRLADPDMEKICGDLRVLKRRMRGHGGVGWIRFLAAFDCEAGFNKKIHPLANRPMESRDLKLRLSVAARGRHCREGPFIDPAARIDKVIAHFDCVRDAVFILERPSVWWIEARVQD